MSPKRQAALKRAERYRNDSEYRERQKLQARTFVFQRRLAEAIEAARAEVRGMFGRVPA